MRKVIDIPDKLIQALKIKAFKAGTNPKNYIETLVIEDLKVKHEK